MLPGSCIEFTIRLIILLLGWQNETQGVTNWSERPETGVRCHWKMMSEELHFQIWIFLFKLQTTENYLKLLVKKNLFNHW